MMNVNLPRGSRFNVSIRKDARRIYGTANWEGRINTMLQRVIRQNNAVAKVTSVAETGARQFIELHFVIDNSASMGVGASSRDH
jgi:predicted Co/Zn/Cd cation transporter (cation efflux family)